MNLPTIRDRPLVPALRRRFPTPATQNHVAVALARPAQRAQPVGGSPPEPPPPHPPSPAVQRLRTQGQSAKAAFPRTATGEMLFALLTNWRSETSDAASRYFGVTCVML